MAPSSRVVYPLLERPLEVRETLRATPKAHLLAEVIPAFSAYTAVSARHADLQGYAVAEGIAAHLRAYGDDHARGLVTERQGLAGTEVAICELLEVRDI